jgi:hypothetical protein
MLSRPQTLAFGFLALVLAPSLAHACDEEAKAVAKACVVVSVQSCGGSTAVSVESVDRVVPAGTRRPEWEPGHLIDRDSLKTSPEKNPEPETWVKVSSRNVNKSSWRYSYKVTKKAKSRVVVTPGPRS